MAPPTPTKELDKNDEIFTPRVSAVRTPPKNPIINIEKETTLNITQQKTQLGTLSTETVPPTGATTRRTASVTKEIERIAYSRETPTQKRPRQDIEPEDHEQIQLIEAMSKSPKELLAQASSCLDRITRATSKEVNSKVSFTRQDQANIREQVDNINKIMIALTTMVYEANQSNFRHAIQAMQKSAQITPAREIAQSHSASTINTQPAGSSQLQPATTPEPTSKQGLSYSEAAKMVINRTPKPVARRDIFTTRVEVKEVRDPNEALKRLKTHVSAKEVGGAFVAIRKLPEGGLIIDSQSREQQAALKSALSKHPEQYTTKELGSLQPRLILTGVDAGYTDDMLVDSLLSQNEEVFGEGANKERVKIAGKRRCRNPQRENWVLEVNPKDFRAIQKNGYVNLDLVRIRVEQHIYIRRCFRCNNFGHTTVNCPDKQDTCPRCAEQHRLECCKSEKLTCINCKRLGAKDTAHAAMDGCCPVYQKKVQIAINNIDYGSSP